MRKFGLIGYPLTHSFSKKYFTEKFEKEGITECVYDLYEIPEIGQLVQIIKSNPELEGINVTIPYKKEVIPFLDKLDPSAEKVGAVNVIKLKGGCLTGYNSDYYGFKESLVHFLGSKLSGLKGIVLGTGGASNAVHACLTDLNIPFKKVSRTSTESILSYEDLFELPDLIENHHLLVNTTPLGMYPHIEECPHIPYERLGSEHFLFDLIYNPPETVFLKKGKDRGAKTMHGLEMLYLQAEKAWEIWAS